MAHPPFWPFSPKSNGFSVSPVSKGEKTAKIRLFKPPSSSQESQGRPTELSRGAEFEQRSKFAHRQRGGRWSKIRAEG
jgi:hypothetical protein